MPWCDDCDRFYTQSTLNPDGTCPDGHQAAPLPPPGIAASGQAASGQVSSADGVHADGVGEGKDRVAPWHFWVMVVALAVYLGWRLIQGIMWVIGLL